jgi:hypothetical protein
MVLASTVVEMVGEQLVWVLLDVERARGTRCLRGIVVAEGSVGTARARTPTAEAES